MKALKTLSVRKARAAVWQC